MEVDLVETGRAHLKRLRNALERQVEDELICAADETYAAYIALSNSKVKAIQEDIAASSWGALEMSFLWLGGWRPTAAVVLVYSLMGMQIESELLRILEGIEVPSMATLTATQLSALNDVQQRNRIAEDELSERHACLQMLLADQQMAKAAACDPPPSESDDLSEIRKAMQPKLASLREILLQAEQLRFQTVEKLVRILKPLQFVQYSVAAIELAIAVKKLGNSTLSSQIMESENSIRDIVSQGNVESLQRALQGGGDPSAPDYDGRTPLHVAASKGYLDCVRLLLKAGVDVNKKDNYGTSPVLAALQAGHGEVVKLLAENGAETQSEEAGIELCKAIASGDVTYVERLVKNGVDPNVSDYAMNTPLHLAAAAGSPETVKLLVNEGADLLAKERHGFTPLDEARESGREAVVKIIEDEIAKRQA